MTHYIVGKLTLDICSVQEVELPKQAMFLSLQVRHNVISVWFRVREDLRDQTQTIFVRMAKTGEWVPGPESKWSYIGTVILDDGETVRHVFWRIPVEG